MICFEFITYICILAWIHLNVIFHTENNIGSLLRKIINPFSVMFAWVIKIWFVKVLVFWFKKVYFSLWCYFCLSLFLCCCWSNLVESCVVVNGWLLLKWFCLNDCFAFGLWHFNTLFINNFLNMKIWNFLTKKFTILIWCILFVKILCSFEYLSYLIHLILKKLVKF